LLLLCCAQICSASESGDRIEILLRQDLDWEYLIETALGHRTLPMLYQGLVNSCPAAIAPGIVGQLKGHFSGNARRSFALTGELLKCLNLFDAHGISAVPFKGPVLGAKTYGDYAMRQFDDLDILVHEKDVLKARDLLVSQGYRPEFELTRAQEQAYLFAQSEFKVLDDESDVIVELHWRIAERYFCFPLDPEELWERLVPVSLAGQEVHTFSAEDLVLILCVHGAKHIWQRLVWICDVARLVSSHGGMDWQWVLQQARRLGSERMLLLGLFLAHELLGAAPPAEMLGMARADPSVGFLAAQVRQQLFTDRPTGDWDMARFHLRARERWQDRMEHTLRLAVTTSPGDWALIRLPDPLFPLYYLLRPIRLVGTYAAALLRQRL
jgi:hypothetical protein